MVLCRRFDEVDTYFTYPQYDLTFCPLPPFRKPSLHLPVLTALPSTSSFACACPPVLPSSIYNRADINCWLRPISPSTWKILRSKNYENSEGPIARGKPSFSFRAKMCYRRWGRRECQDIGSNSDKQFNKKSSVAQGRHGLHSPVSFTHVFFKFTLVTYLAEL